MKIFQTKLIKNQKIHPRTNLVSKNDIKMFILMSIWMNERNIIAWKFYSNLNMEDITYADYIMLKEFVKTLKKKLG